jgi:hypothetical protein
MAKIDLKFLCSEATNCFINVKHINVIELIKGNHSQIKEENIIRISITEFGKENQIWLDKSTAIKFAKTLRTEINKIES